MRQIQARGDRKTVKKLTKLLKEAESDGAFRVAIRIRAIVLSIEERGSNDISKVLRVDRTRIPVWVNQWNEYGEEALLEGYRSGRRKMLDAHALESLYDIVESGPVAYGLDTGIWNSKIIAKIIKDEFDVDYHPGHVRKILKEIGLSVQRPTVNLVNAQESAKNRWVRYTFPNLKKKQKPRTALSSTKTRRRSGRTQRSTKPGHQ